MNPLDGVRLKIERAEYHLQELNRFICKWEETKPFVCTGREYPNQPAYIYTIEINAVPGGVGVVVGDVLHNIHSALDNIVWQLAILSTSNPYERTAFPIFSRVGKSTENEINRLLRDIPANARLVIESLQPYKATNPQSHPLYLLQELSNCDKHRKLTITGQRLRFEMRRGMITHDLNDYTVEIIVPMVYKNSPPPPPEIFCDCLVINDKNRIQMRIDVVEAIYKFVNNKVYPRFLEFFP